MPIADYDFRDRVFFARESGVISADDARDWAKRLADCAQQSPEPIIALVDALGVRLISLAAHDIFAKASFTENLLAVVVATTTTGSLTSSNIGLLGKPRFTWVFPTLDEARQYAERVLRDNTPKQT